jgi:hypothetical protein
MAPLIVGSTLSDLGRNSLLAEQMQRDAQAQTANLLLSQMMANQLNQREQRAMENDRQYRNNLLAQRDREWTTPNATSMAGYQNQREIARMPWDLGMTPGERERIDLERRRIDAMERNPFLGGRANPLLDDIYRTREREMQLQSKANAAADQMNASLNSKFSQLALPRLKERMDAGTDNPGKWTFGFGGMTGANAEAAAKGILGLDVPPDWLDTGTVSSKTKEWWNSPSNTLKYDLKNLAARQLAEEFPEMIPYVQWDSKRQKFVPKSQIGTLGSDSWLGGAFGGALGGSGQPVQKLPHRPAPAPDHADAALDNLILPDVPPPANTNRLLQPLNVRTNAPTISPFNVGGYSFTPIQ